jgi:hypothetical protein
MQSKSIGRYSFGIVLLISSVLLSIATVYAQVDDVGLRFIRIQQDKVHQQMMGGVAGNPWQYRILADWMISILISVCYRLGFDSPEVTAFIVFRFIQCLLILGAAGVYYRKLGLSLYSNLLGLSILTWSMSFSLYNSDLSFNNFFDVAFYVIGAVLVMSEQFVWIIPLMILAALNRETSALIPMMGVAYAYFTQGSKERIKPIVLYTAGSFVVFAVIFVGLRYYYGEQTFLTADGYHPGFGLFLLNLRRVVTWEQLLITFGILPVMALFAYGKWTRPLQIFFWTVVPIWMIVHFFSSLVAETRLLLVPQALVFIPGVLFGIMNQPSPAELYSSRD